MSATRGGSEHQGVPLTDAFEHPMSATHEHLGAPMSATHWRSENL